MAGWAKAELQRIGSTDDLHIAPLRPDGVTYGTPTWIWSVVVADTLYVRAYNGTSSRWYEAAMRQHAGRITAAGIAKEVAFEAVTGSINDVSTTRTARNTGSPYLSPMIGARARAATVKVVPRDVKGDGHVG